MKTTKTNSTPKTLAARNTKKSLSVDTFDEVEGNDAYDEMTAPSVAVGTQKSGSKVGLVVIFVLILLGLGAYRYRNLLTPATVNGQPIYVWDYLWKLHTQYGQEQLNSMTTEMMIRQAVAKANVSVPASDVDNEVKLVEQEASSSGGISVVLASQHMTMDEFRNRISLQLAVKKILADKITVSAQEVDDTYKKNKDFYKGMSEVQAREGVKKQIEDQKFQTEVSKWLSDVRSQAKVSISFPGL